MAGTAKFEVDAKEIDRLHQALKNFPGSAEAIINDIFHDDGATLIKDEVRRLMPVSGKTWKGKPAAAKDGNSLTEKKGNLFIEVTTTSKYHYLYFPDDGTNTRHHVGEQHFFKRGGEAQETEIINRCLYMIRRRLGD